MSMTVLSDISAALSLYLRPKLETQINSVAVLPYLLPVVRGQGQNAAWTVEFSGASNAVASAEGVARSSSDADSEIEVAATLPWAQYDKVASVSDLSQAAAGSNINPESIGAMGRDLLLGRAANQVRRVALGIARDLYAGNPAATPPQLAGAATAIASSGALAGITPGSNPGQYPEWVSVVDDWEWQEMSFQKIREFITKIYDASGHLPEFITCGSTVFNAVRALYTDYEAHVVREISTARGGGSDSQDPRVVKLGAGMRAIEVDQVPFVLDRHATADTAYAWNTQFVEIQQLDPLQSVLDQGEQGIQDLFRRLAGNGRVQLPREQVEGMLARGPGLRPSIKILGDRGLSKEAVVHLWAQVVYKRRNALGKFSMKEDTPD